MGDWSAWIGRSVTQSDVLTPSLVRRHRATLDAADEPAPLSGIHWCLCPPDAATADLDEDGHPRRDAPDSFLPPIDLPRRMWASSTVEFIAPIRVGAAITRTSRIADIVEKAGSSGRLAFVTLDHVVASDGVDAVRETQTLVYRQATPVPTKNRVSGDGEAAPHSPPPPLNANDWPHCRSITPSAALLFRFSALTFNAHRIHYDLPYARDAEGYAGLVVHGPLTATLLLDHVTSLFGAPRQFSFRASAPAFAGEALMLGARHDGKTIALIAHGPRGVCMTASAQP